MTGLFHAAIERGVRSALDETLPEFKVQAQILELMTLKASVMELVVSQPDVRCIGEAVSVDDVCALIDARIRELGGDPGPALPPAAHVAERDPEPQPGGGPEYQFAERRNL